MTKWECGCEIDGQHIFSCKDHRKEISFEGLEYGLPEEREEEDLK